MRINRNRPLVILPIELIAYIASFLRPQDISLLRRVAHYFRNIFSSSIRFNLAEPNIREILQQFEGNHSHISLEYSRRHDLDNNFLSALFQHFNRLRSLNLARNNLNSSNIRELIASIQNSSPNLEILFFRDNNFNEQIIAEFARAPFAQNLRVIDIRNCNLEWEPWELGMEESYLRRARPILDSFPNLEVIIWDHPGINFGSAVQLAFQLAAKESDRKIEVVMQLPNRYNNILN